MAGGVRGGLVSDTNGLLLPNAAEFGSGVGVLHAGEICDAANLQAHKAIAPRAWRRENNDSGAWTDGLRQPATVEAGDGGILLVSPGRAKGGGHAGSSYQFQPGS